MVLITSAESVPKNKRSPEVVYKNGGFERRSFASYILQKLDTMDSIAFFSAVMFSGDIFLEPQPERSRRIRHNEVSRYMETSMSVIDARC
jgi:hypothetical protein